MLYILVCCFASSALTQPVSLLIVYSDDGGGVVVVLSKDKVEELYEEESSTLFSLQEKGSHVPYKPCIQLYVLLGMKWNCGKASQVVILFFYLQPT